MADWNSIGVGVIVWLALSVAGISLAIQRGLAGTPRGIVRRLRRNGGRLDVKVGARGSTWDPSKGPGQGGARWGRATATYTLHEGDVVHLHYQPRSGPSEDVEGPIPEIPKRPLTVLRLLVAGYAVSLLVGFGAGYAVGRGPIGERLAWGAGGVLAAMVLLRVVYLMFNVGKAIHDVGGQRNTPPSW